MNRYPNWVNWLVLIIVVGGAILAMPNVFGDDPAIYISRSDGEPVQGSVIPRIRNTLMESGIEFLDAVIEEDAALVRLNDIESQLRASDALRAEFVGSATDSSDAAQPPGLYTVALTLAPRMPDWMSSIGLRPMSLGLDLRGGVYFLLQVDLEGAIQQFLNSYRTELNTQFREADIRNSIAVDGETLVVSLFDENDMDAAEEIIDDLDTGDLLTGTSRLIVNRTQVDGRPGFRVGITEVLLREQQDLAIEQNTITLRNRVNELGVSESVVQRQGLDRILVQLPGVQDPAEAKRNLDAAATLEYRLVDMDNDPYAAAERGRAPIGSELFYDQNGVPVLLKRDVIVTGDQVTNATPGYDQNGLPAVIVTLSAQGGRRMLNTTQQNLGRNMAVLFIEDKLEVSERNGEQVLDRVRDERVISNATIQGIFSTRFHTTGLTQFEAQSLALLLRAGALATPVVIIEERTIGPSLGQDNINKGRLAIIVGFLAVVLFMSIYYRAFGLVANLALFMNLVLIIAALSLLQAALTLPGIAGIVLTVGMAVDANVLIFERIREELRNGNSPQASIRAGYDKAFSTIADANITTLIAAVVLLAYGTGPIKGFAVTLAIGILTSMFTAIVGTRVVINLLYGSKPHLKRLSIGGRLSDATA